MDVEEIFRSHADALFRYLARYCGDPHLAQDAVQETFVRLQETPPAHAGAVRSWLFRTGTNVVRDRLRVESNRRRLLESEAHRVPRPTGPLDPKRSVERDEDLLRLRRAMSELREKERRALLMREEGFKHREIAEALETTTGSVGTLIARSLAKLAAAMEGEEGAS